MRKDIADLWNLVEPYAKGAGFDLVELQWGREGEGWALRIYIDRPWTEDGSSDGGPRLPGASDADQLFAEAEGGGVGFEDCERVSRDVSAALDVADLIKHAYRLEVSSPGLERPLRREQDFRRFAGQQAKAKIRTADPVDGRRNFSGTLVGAEGGVVEIECDGQLCKVPIDLMTKAHLVPDWEAEFRRAAGSESDGRTRPQLSSDAGAEARKAARNSSTRSAS